MNEYGEFEAEIHSFLTSVLDSVSDQLQESAALLQRQDFHYPFNKRLGMFRARINALEKIKICCSCQRSNYDSLLIQRVAHSLYGQTLLGSGLLVETGMFSLTL
jgi:hypothetical protein